MRTLDPIVLRFTSAASCAAGWVRYGFLRRRWTAALCGCTACVVLTAGAANSPSPMNTPGPSAAQSSQTPPPAPVRVVTDTVHGITLEDPYRWMEQPGNPEFTEWMSAQGRYARTQLESIPGRDDLVRRIRELTRGTTGVGRVTRAGDALFFLRTDRGAPLSKLVVRTPDGAERVLFDPETARKSEGPHLSIDNFRPSQDGRLVAVNVGQGGGEITSVHVLETATGAMRPEVIERIWGEFPVSWLPDASGFFYTQMAERGLKDAPVDRMRGQRVRFHHLGTAAADDPVLLGPGVSPKMPFDAREFPLIRVPEASDWVLARGVGARSEMRLCVARRAELSGAETPWRCLAEYDDLIEDVEVHGSDLYLLSSKDAPNRRVLRVRLTAPSLTASETVIPAREDRILTGIAAARDALYVQEMERGSDRIWRMPYDGGALQEIPLPLAQASVEMVASPQRDGFVFSVEAWTQPKGWYSFDSGTSRIADTGLRTTLPAGFSIKTEIESVDVKSFDGTLVPLTILHRPGFPRDGSRPALLFGYAGYGISLRPSFDPPAATWVERGGVAAFCHARGGGEKGRAWHLAGKGPNKRNGVRDFIACAEYLSTNGYSRPSRLGAMGGSAGGVLLGGAITERPDAFGAAVIRVGILNPVRILEGINGANQVPELGDPRTPEGYRTLAAMDPYHHVRPGVRYPAVLLSVGLNDNRVSSWHSGKFAARLRAATASGKPVLIRIDEEAGHGFGSTRDQRAEELGDMFAFLLSQLGHPEFQPRK